MGNGIKMVTKTEYQQIQSYVTLDGSQIRELMHPRVNKNQAQSLAEAIVPPGAKTRLHRHLQTEELYHFTSGHGLMTLGDETFDVRGGDTVCIPPGTPHQLNNTGNIVLKLLCCCSPAYSDDDTELLE